MNSNPRILAEAYQRNNQNLTKAAREVGICRDTARDRLVKAGVIDVDARRKSKGTKRPLSESVSSVLQLDKLSSDAVRGVLQTGKFTVLELCEKLNARPGDVRTVLVEMEGVKRDGDRFWIDRPEPTINIRHDAQAAALEEELALYKKRYAAALKEVQEAQALLKAQASLGQDAVRAITPPREKSKGEATAIVIGSDWHCGAIVRPATVNYLNEYNVDIFQERAERFFLNSAKLVNKEQRDVGINHLLFGLLGDLIENSLHDELIEEQTHSPIEQMQIAESAIKAGLDYWLTTDIEYITVVTAPGNHGRLTEKMRAATNFKNSLEMLLYRSLAAHYRNESRIRFQISDGYFNYYDIYGETIAFHHGDAIRYGGGIGGISIPLRKFLHRAQAQRRFTMSVNGHFHTERVEDDFMINGSLVGPTAYGMKLGFAPERPQQIFRLLDKEHRWTAYFPILVKEGAR